MPMLPMTINAAEVEATTPGLAGANVAAQLVELTPELVKLDLVDSIESATATVVGTVQIPAAGTYLIHRGFTAELAAGDMVELAPWSLDFDPAASASGGGQSEYSPPADSGRLLSILDWGWYTFDAAGPVDIVANITSSSGDPMTVDGAATVQACHVYVPPPPTLVIGLTFASDVDGLTLDPGAYVAELGELFGGATGGVATWFAPADTLPTGPDDPTLTYAPLVFSSQHIAFGIGGVARINPIDHPIYGTVNIYLWCDPAAVEGDVAGSAVWGYATDDVPAVGDQDWRALGFEILPPV